MSSGPAFPRILSVCGLLLFLETMGADPASGAGGPPTGKLPEPACRASDLDLNACRVWVEGIEQPPAAKESLLREWGLVDEPANLAASTGQSRRTQSLLVWKQSCPIGSLLITGDRIGIQVARADAGPSFLPSDSNAWLSIAVPSRQPAAKLIPMPTGMTTRALLVTESRTSRGGDIRGRRLYRPRLFNLAPLATANADSEYTDYPERAPPVVYAAQHVLEGTGSWRNVGPDRAGRIRRVPLAISPAWFTVSWQEAQTVSGLALDSTILDFDLEQFQGPNGINPAVGEDSAWSRVRGIVDAEEKDVPLRRFFFPACQTRGLRLKIVRTASDPVAEIRTLHVYADLGSAPVPEARPVDRPPPLSIAYELPEDGEFSMAIDDASGIRIRNLVARVPRTKGSNAEAWDLKDDQGRTVGPGKYHWKAITHPPLRMEYRMTLYPNVSQYASANSPWLNGQNGEGGWMSDHMPPCCVAAAGSKIFLSSRFCESGAGLIECTLDGRKTWGTGNLLAWTSPSLLASDGDRLFGAAMYGDHYGHGARKEYIWRVDPATHEVTPILIRGDTDERRIGITGLEAWQGKLYAAINAGTETLAGAINEAQIDLEHCTPAYREVRVRGREDERKANPRMDWLRLLRLKDQPPGQRNRKGSLIWLESTGFSGNRNHIVVAFKKPMALGSMVFPLPESGSALRLSLLKPEAPYPPDPFKEEHWSEFWKGTTGGWSVVPFPEQAVSRALRITFVREDNDLADAWDTETGTAEGASLFEDGSVTKSANAKMWKGKIEGLKLMRRRFHNLSPEARIHVSSGKVNRQGEWDAARTTPLSEADPGIYVQEWSTPRTVCGLAIKEVDGQRTLIDVFTGGSEEPMDIRAERNWKNVAAYVQPRRDCFDGYSQSYNADARYLDGYVAFPQSVTTRAIRLRVAAQWTEKSRRPTCVRSDRGGETMDPARCRIYGVAALEYIGGEMAEDERTHQRIEELDGASGKVLREVALRNAGKLGVGPTGDVFAISGTNVVRVVWDGSPPVPVDAGVLKPAALAVDRSGCHYVFDAAPDRHLVRVYAADGGFIRTIGTPGGFRPGRWDPTRMGDVRDMDIDERGQLWVVESQDWPKRITVWKADDGTFVREHLGNTSYGGGGVLDPGNPRRLFYGPLEFELDWSAGTSRLKALTWIDTHSSLKMFNSSQAGEWPVRIDGRTYLVTRSEFAQQACGMVYLYDESACRLRRVAAVGLANGFGALNTPEIVASLPAKLTLADSQFMWSDRNGDGDPQVSEVQLVPKAIQHVGWFDDSLGIQASTGRYEVARFLDNGAPVYEFKTSPNGRGGRMRDGRYFCMRQASPSCDAVLTSEGKRIWSYPNEGYGVQSLFFASPWRPDQVVAEFDVAGMVTAHAGDLGDFVVTSGNVGSWNIWTSDGLLAGSLFRDCRDPSAKAWSMREHEKGLRLEDVTLGQEHIAAYFCRSPDNRYYAVAGHNHISVVEILGLDRFKRLSGTLTISGETVAAAEAWDREAQQRVAYRRARLLACPARGAASITIDGDATEWEGVVPASIRVGTSTASFRILHDSEMLYLCYDVRAFGPMKNSGHDWKTYFKSGACVDFQFGSNPEASPSRTTPVEGDMRLLLTVAEGRPEAVLYRSVVPGAPAEEAWETRTEVAAVRFDRVERLADVRLACRPQEDGYVMEAAIPLTRLGLTIQSDKRYRFDWGILVSGPDGTEVLQRRYWANPSNATVADMAAEATIHPELWGWLYFTKSASSWHPALDVTGEPRQSVEDELEGL